MATQLTTEATIITGAQSAAASLITQLNTALGTTTTPTGDLVSQLASLSSQVTSAPSVQTSIASLITQLNAASPASSGPYLSSQLTTLGSQITALLAQLNLATATTIPSLNTQVASLSGLLTSTQTNLSVSQTTITSLATAVTLADNAAAAAQTAATTAETTAAAALTTAQAQITSFTTAQTQIIAQLSPGSGALVAPLVTPTTLPTMVTCLNSSFAGLFGGSGTFSLSSNAASIAGLSTNFFTTANSGIVRRGTVKISIPAAVITTATASSVTGSVVAYPVAGSGDPRAGTPLAVGAPSFTLATLATILTTSSPSVVVSYWE